MLFLSSIFALWFLTVLLCHSSEKLQFPPQEAGMSSISPWDQSNSLLPWGSNSVGDVSQLQHRRACPNTSLQSCLRKTGEIIHNQPPRQNQSVLWKAVEQHPVTFQLFGSDLDFPGFEQMTGRMCHSGLGHCYKPQWGFYRWCFVFLCSCFPDISSCSHC